MSNNQLQDLVGVWRNAVGSTMSIKCSEHPNSDFRTFYGVYLTAVQSREGVVGEPSPLTGMVKILADVTSEEVVSLVCFSVLWSQGKSVTTWVGQCMWDELRKCKMIFATWMLATHNPADRWRSNCVNQDTFMRLGDDNPAPPPEINEPFVNNERLLGTWKSMSGDSLTIDCAAKTGLVKGFTVIEPETGPSGEAFLLPSTSTWDLVGLTGCADDFVAVTLVGIGTIEARGWTGFIYKAQGGDLPMLETSWLTHLFSLDLHAPRRNVRVGFDNYQLVPSSPLKECPAGPSNLRTNLHNF